MATLTPTMLPATSSPNRTRLGDVIWRAPLVPVALAFTAGIVVDRCLSVPLTTSVSFFSALAFAWLMAFCGRLRPVAPYLLGGAVVVAGAVHHQWYRESVPENDIRFFATAEGRPARIRGVVHSEPVHVPSVENDPLRTFPTKLSTRLAVAARELEQRTAWIQVTGLLQATLSGPASQLHVGDEIELIGLLAQPQSAANPGEFDYAVYLYDQRIGAVLSVPDAPGAALVLADTWPMSPLRWLGVLRERASRHLGEHLPARQRAVAAALLLGDGSGMTSDAWDPYLRTGVIHVLAISGQHLVVLAAFLAILCRFLNVRGRTRLLGIALLLLGYALLTGGRPPIMRAVWMVFAYAGGELLRRMVLPANTFAFAWLGVALWNPTDVFNTGCQLSFIAIAVLMWGVGNWETQEEDPLQRVIDESRSWLGLTGINLLRRLRVWYAANALVWLAVTPLVADRYHVISPVAILIGPPVVFVSSLALLFGFGLLLSAPLLPPLAMLFAWLTQGSLFVCEAIANAAAQWPFGYFYVPDLPDGWLAVFYVVLLASLTLPLGHRRAWWCFTLGGAGLALGAILLYVLPRPSDFRVTFLAVGHGGCTVIEAPGGEVILYDAGAITGPDATRRQIAPFLWSRGIRKIDDVIISHGDLDHFNGLPALLERFSVRRVSLTPTFADRTAPGIGAALRSLERAGLDTRIVQWPDRWEIGGVAFATLHPPAKGPAGNENARSLVLVVRHQELGLLLTGDLEGTGLQRLLTIPAQPVEVLMAPHHGSRTANTRDLAAWARPKLVVSCQGRPKSAVREPNPYEAIGARWLSTWSQGAVTIRREGEEWIAEGYQTRGRWTIRP